MTEETITGLPQRDELLEHSTQSQLDPTQWSDLHCLQYWREIRGGVVQGEEGDRILTGEVVVVEYSIL